jgi:uncharacterized membrane protein YjgN (DUF898 family)
MSEPIEVTPSGGGRALAPEFHGRDAEYFRLWIANLLFTLLTLGIFSAWAKVRKKRYFYGNTRFAGDCFDYTGQPLAILKGRLVAALIVAAYFLSGEIVAGSQVWFWMAGAVALPWVATRALLFNAANSAWRGVRFDFRAHAWDAFRYFVPRMLLVPLSLGLAFPWLQARGREWLMRQHAHGRARCECDIPMRRYYGAWVRAFGLMLLLGVATGAVGGMLAMKAEDWLENLPEGFGWVSVAIPILLGYLGYAFAWAVLTARTFNAAWSGTRLGNLTFEANMESNALAKIYLVNILAIFATFGLAVPWATLRTYRYRLSCLSARTDGDIIHQAAPGQAPIGAAGQEMGDLFNVDFGL